METEHKLFLIRFLTKIIRNLEKKPDDEQCQSKHVVQYTGTFE
jgi:hypothetical protein